MKFTSLLIIAICIALAGAYRTSQQDGFLPNLPAGQEIVISANQEAQVLPHVSDSYQQMLDDPTKYAVLLKHDPRPFENESNVFMKTEKFVSPDLVPSIEVVSQDIHTSLISNKYIEIRKYLELLISQTTLTTKEQSILTRIEELNIEEEYSEEKAQIAELLGELRGRNFDIEVKQISNEVIDDLDRSMVSTADTEELYEEIVGADKVVSLKEELEADIALLEILPASLESEVLKTETLMEEIKIEVDNGLPERSVQEMFTTAITDVKGIAVASEGTLPVETENKVLIAEKEIQEKISAAPT